MQVEPLKPEQKPKLPLDSAETIQLQEETLYLLQIPGMRESILEGMKMPIEVCDDHLEW